jgi:hypothetical protein
MRALINLFAFSLLLPACAFAEEQERSVQSRTLLNVHFLSDGSIAETDVLSSDGHADLAICRFKLLWGNSRRRAKLPQTDRWEKRSILLSWLPSKPMTCD